MFLTFFKNFYLLRREPFYHKIQYSKVLKHDIVAAVFGVVCGAFSVYLSLNSLGSGSPDLTDLTIFLWYIFILYKIFIFSFFNKYFSFNFLFLIFNFLFFIAILWFYTIKENNKKIDLL